MKSILLALLLLLPLTVRAEEIFFIPNHPDPEPQEFGIAWKTWLHMGAGYVVSDMAYVLWEKTPPKTLRTPFGGYFHDPYHLTPLFCGIGIGILKELYDQDTPGNHFDWYDVAHTAEGALIHYEIHF